MKLTSKFLTVSLSTLMLLSAGGGIKQVNAKSRHYIPTTIRIRQQESQITKLQKKIRNERTTLTRNSRSRKFSKLWHNKHASAGYSFRLRSGAQLSTRAFGKRLAVKPATLHHLVRNHTNFEVVNIRADHNNTEDQIVSQNHKYRGWVEDSKLFNRVNLNRHATKAVSLMRRVVSRTMMSTRKPHYTKSDLNNLNLARRIANQFRGGQQKRLLNDVNQVERFAKTGKSSELPTDLLN